MNLLPISNAGESHGRKMIRVVVSGFLVALSRRKLSMAKYFGVKTGAGAYRLNLAGRSRSNRSAPRGPDMIRFTSGPQAVS